MLALLAMRLEHHGYRTERATCGAEARARFARGGLDVLVLDLRLPDADGLELLMEFRARSPETPVIMLTAHGSIDTAFEAMRRGAFGFLTKPFNHHELLQRVEQAIENGALRREVADFRRIVGEPSEGSIVGASRAIGHLREFVARVGPTSATVLLSGEAGTGKALTARALHQRSARAAGPFVTLHCDAIPGELIERELFGTPSAEGASAAAGGLVGAAHGGTLFLDEVGDVPPHVQRKLLRLIETHRYAASGGNAERNVDVRFIASTQRDLRADVARGRFREELFLALCQAPAEVPALRARAEDIPLLAEVFLRRAAALLRVRPPTIGPDALAWMLSHPWPGNVRELANVMESIVIAAAGAPVPVSLLERIAGGSSPRPATEPASQTSALTEERGATTLERSAIGRADPVRILTDASAPLPSLREARDAFERAYLLEVLRRANGNMTAAAQVADRNRSDFYDLLRRHGIRWREGP